MQKFKNEQIKIINKKIIKQIKKKEMRTLLFVILVFAQSGHALGLNRSQLIVWIYNYLTENYFDWFKSNTILALVL